jgi:hypothetical protein
MIRGIAPITSITANRIMNAEKISVLFIIRVNLFSIIIKQV